MQLRKEIRKKFRLLRDSYPWPLWYRCSVLPNERFNGLLPFGLLAQLVARALHRYRRGQGFKSRTSLNIFRLSFRNCKGCVYKCDDLLSYNSSPRSSHTYDFHIFITWKGYCRVRVTTKSIWTTRFPLPKITKQRKFWIRWSSHLYSLKLILYSKVFVPETGGKTCTICLRSQSLAIFSQLQKILLSTWKGSRSRSCLSRRKAHIFVLKSTSLIRTLVTKNNVNPALRTLVICALSTFIVWHNYVDIVSCQIMTHLYRLSLKSEASFYILFLIYLKQ